MGRKMQLEENLRTSLTGIGQGVRSGVLGNYEREYAESQKGLNQVNKSLALAVVEEKLIKINEENVKKNLKIRSWM